MSRFKKKLAAFSAMLTFLTLSSAVSYAVAPSDLIGSTPGFGISKDGNTTNIENTTGKAGTFVQGDFLNFNVDKGDNVFVGYSNTSQGILARVLGGNESKIYGSITSGCAGGGTCTSYGATGSFFLINPAGVLFGPGSTVDLNSFTASTFDFKGAKNLQGMSQAELEAYQSGVLNKFSALPSVNGENRNYGSIYFDSNYTEAFEKAGIDMSKLVGKTQIILDGTTFAHFNKDGSIAEVNPNKSTVIISDNIQYKDSLIKTGTNFNYTSPNATQSYSNLRLVTADGVTFNYLANGYASDYTVAQDTKTDVKRTIDIDNSGLKSDEAAIKSGDIHIINQSNAADSNVKISNTVIKGTKLVNDENGDIKIVSAHDINIDKTRLETTNGYVSKDGKDYNTEKQNGGEVYLKAGKNVDIKDSLILTAGSKEGTASDKNSGSVRIYAMGDKLNIDNTKILAKGNIDAQSNKGTTITGSLVRAHNDLDTSKTKDVKLVSSGDIKAHNSVITASNDLSFNSSWSDNSVAGNIIISSDLDSNNKNQTLILADNKLSIEGANTKIDNASLAYKEIKFYNDKTTGTNNVTVANNSTFSPHTIDANGKKTVSKNVTLETNGDFTLDKANMQVAAYNLTFEREADGVTLKDDGTPSAVNYDLTFKQVVNADEIDVKSTQGNVNAQNNTNIVANENIILTSEKKDVNVKNSNLTTNDGHITLIAWEGQVNIKDNSNVIAGKKLNVAAYETITFGPQGAKDVSIDNSTNLTAGEDMKIMSLAGNITGEKTTMPTLTYGNRLTFNAAKDNVFTSENSLKSVNVDYIAGGANKFYTQDDIQFVNSTFEAPVNFVESGDDVILNNLTIKQATTNAKDTVTEIYANGNVTTNDVTGTAKTDINGVKKFPQSVSVNRTGTDKTVLDINQTKLKITTETVKDPANPDDGSIILNVKNANNKEAGLELVARNVDKLDKDPTGGNFRPGYFKSGEAKWDENIDKHEGPEVHLDADDDKVSITNIDTDKLFLNEEDTFIAATDAPDGTPTITVKDQGGFNMDPNEEYDPEPDGFEYKDHIQSELIKKDVDPEITKTTGEEYLISTDSKTYEVETKVTEPLPGTLTTTYKETTNVYGTDTTVNEKTTTTTTYRDTKHEITFDKQGNEDKFILVYDKTRTEVDVDVKDPVTTTEKRVEVLTDKISEKFVEDCPDVPEIDKPETEIGNADSYINIIKLPKEQVEISKTSKVSDNTVDQTSSIMSAAAKVDLDEATASDTSASFSESTSTNAPQSSAVQSTMSQSNLNSAAAQSTTSKKEEKEQE